MIFMAKYIIMTDSCVDLPESIVNDLGVEVIPLSVNIEGKDYYNYLDERDIKYKEFYSLLRDNIVPTTAQINPNRFIEFMETYLKQDYDILYIAFSSALSGTYNSSQLAKEELNERFPNKKIRIVDSLCASMGQGLLVTYAAKMKNEGKNIEDVAKWVEINKKKICHLFTVGDLNYLRRGGRLSYSKAILGTILKIKPLLHVNDEGKLVQTGATRGKIKALKKMVERMKDTIINPETQVVYISHGDCKEEVKVLKELILSK